VVGLSTVELDDFQRVWKVINARSHMATRDVTGVRVATGDVTGVGVATGEVTCVGVATRDVTGVRVATGHVTSGGAASGDKKGVGAASWGVTGGGAATGDVTFVGVATHPMCSFCGRAWQTSHATHHVNLRILTPRVLSWRETLPRYQGGTRIRHGPRTSCLVS
jgi:hypothetical protein